MKTRQLIAAVIALAVARFGAARYVVGFKGTDPAAQSTLVELKGQLTGLLDATR